LTELGPLYDSPNESVTSAVKNAAPVARLSGAALALWQLRLRQCAPVGGTASLLPPSRSGAIMKSL